jgi:predicted Zn-dependent protease
MKRLKTLLESPTDTQYEQAHQLFLHDRVDEAEQEALELIKTYAKHTQTYFLLAQIARNGRHYQRAWERYNKVLSYEKSNDKARLGRARANFECYRFEDALDDYLTLYEYSFGSVDYLVSL